MIGNLSKTLFIAIFIALGAHADSSTVRDKLVAAAVESTNTEIRYDPTYYKIKYPGGDVPKGRGVCTDVLIRAYRVAGYDLQKLVHEDMKANFDLYPSKRIWGLKTTDTNIDHRRVPNLQRFFERHGEKLKVSPKADDYQPGDIVTWNVPQPHIGIVVYEKSRDGKRHLVVHNIGSGHKTEDMLFKYPITGHYTYLPY